MNPSGKLPYTAAAPPGPAADLPPPAHRERLPQPHPVRHPLHRRAGDAALPVRLRAELHQLRAERPRGLARVDRHGWRGHDLGSPSATPATRPAPRWCSSTSAYEHERGDPARAGAGRLRPRRAGAGRGAADHLHRVRAASSVTPTPAAASPSTPAASTSSSARHRTTAPSPARSPSTAHRRELKSSERSFFSTVAVEQLEAASI